MGDNTQDPNVVPQQPVVTDPMAQQPMGTVMPTAEAPVATPEPTTVAPMPEVAVTEPVAAPVADMPVAPAANTNPMGGVVDAMQQPQTVAPVVTDPMAQQPMGTVMPTAEAPVATPEPTTVAPTMPTEGTGNTTV